LNETKSVRADVLDFTGKRVKSFREFQARKGVSTWYWDGTNDAGMPLSEGMYFLHITSEGSITTAKIILTR
jgi:flagellar hook assembly protein FlgD